MFNKTVHRNLKYEIYSLIENRVKQLIQAYDKYIDYTKTNEFQDHKRLYEFGFWCGENSGKYRGYIEFMKKYTWLKEKQKYYQDKYPEMLFVDEYLDDNYLFEKYKTGSTSSVRMMGTWFTGDISINDLDIIERGLLKIDNNDRMVYHHFHTNCGATLCFGNLTNEEQHKVLDNNDDSWRFKGVEIISHSSWLFDNKPDSGEYWGVVLYPVNKGFLVLHKF